MWIADYVLMGYGTGAIMAVPAGDQRDFEFARQFGLPIVADPAATGDVVRGARHRADARHVDVARGVRRRRRLRQLGERHAVARRRSHDGRGQVAMTNDWLAANGHGDGTINYKLRDWLFSRQRYWGEPFPIVYDDDGPAARPARSHCCPSRCPRLDDFSPRRRSTPTTRRPSPSCPLGAARASGRTSSSTSATARSATGATSTSCRSGPARCWYELRYLDPTNENRFVDPAVERYWMGPQGARDIRAASTSTSAASSTRCCTCCTPASGTRSCSTSATSSS